MTDLPQPVAHYQDVLKRNAFGNYRDLLEEVTYAPAMGFYLTYMGNQKADPMTGRMPDENYAREILRLFTIDLASAERDDPMFDNAENLNDWRSPMVVFPEAHSTASKSFLGTTIPAGTPAAESIDAALDHIMAHPNIGPFIGRQLIQRFTTSNPDADYVRRVAEAFNRGTYALPNGSTVGDGRKGDVRATISAVLLDPDNDLNASLASDTFGKLREPVLRFTHWARVTGVDASRPEYTAEVYDTTSPRDLNQHPYRSKSVFNFYRPGYIAPGTQSGASGMTVPELQIVNAASTPGFINFMTGMMARTPETAENEEFIEEFEEAGYPYDSALARRSFIPNYARELPLANDPEAMVEALNQELAYGTLSETTKQGIIAAVESLVMDDPDNEAGVRTRVLNAMLMVLASPDYTIQR